jgi:PEP-CTERM motif
VPSTNTSTNNNTLTGTGNSTSEGELTLSTNGQFFVFGGYGADTGTANVSSATAAAPRVVGRLDVATDALDTSTRLNSTTYAGDNFRGVASQDGSAFWLAGNGSNNRGTRFVAMLGATSSSSIQSSQNNTRAVGIYNGQLYTTTSSGVYTVGTGVPTTNNQTTTLLPPGTEFSSSLAYTGFYLTPDGTHLFVATGAAANYIQEFVLNAGNWSADATLTVSGSSSIAYQLTGMTLGNTTTLFYTLDSGTAQNTLNRVTFDSTTGGFGTPSTIATAGQNESFKGVALISPVPEPSTVALLAGGALLAAARYFQRRRRS